MGGEGRWRSTVTATVTTEPGTTSRSFGRARRSMVPVGRWNSRSTTRAGWSSRPNKLAVKLLQLRPYAGKRGQRGKQRIEQRGAHGLNAARDWEPLQQPPEGRWRSRNLVSKRNTEGFARRSRCGYNWGVRKMMSVHRPLRIAALALCLATVAASRDAAAQAHASAAPELMQPAQAAPDKVDRYGVVFDEWAARRQPKSAILVVRRGGKTVFEQGLQRRSEQADVDREPVEADHRRLRRDADPRRQALVHDAAARGAVAVLRTLRLAGRSASRSGDGRAVAGAPLRPDGQRRRRSDLRRGAKARQQRQGLSRGGAGGARRISGEAPPDPRSREAIIPTATPATRC